MTGTEDISGVTLEYTLQNRFLNTCATFSSSGWWWWLWSLLVVVVVAVVAVV